jgi:N-acetylneuraminic acid mutarotase
MSVLEWLRPRAARRAPRSRRLRLEWLEERCVLTPVVAVLSIAPQAGAPFSGPVATFTDPANPKAGPGSFSAVINWGDGTGADTVTASVALVNGQLTVSGSHTYAAAGNDTLAVTVTDNAGDSWTTQASMSTAREEPAAVTAPNGLIYVFGGFGNTGFGGNTSLATVEAYNPTTNTWTAKASMPTARYGEAAVLAPDGLIYVIGGNETGVGNVGTVEAYNPTTDSWTTKTSMPTPRDHLAAALAPDGQIYAFGGYQNVGNVALATVEAYNPTTNTWSTKASMPTARGELAAARGPDGLVYVIGGSTGSTGQTSAVEAYNSATNSWATKASLPNGRYGEAAVLAPDGLIYAIGGFDNNNRSGFLSTVVAYDSASNTWAAKASMPTARYHLAGAAAPDGRLFAIGGLTVDSAVATVEAYLPAFLPGTGSRSITVSSAPAPGTHSPSTPLVVSVLPIAPQAGTPFSGPVATFTDSADPNAAPSSFSAAINWGDGTGADTATASVTLVNGQLTVSGSHTYAAAGNDTLTVTVTDNAGDSWTTQASLSTPRFALAGAAGHDGLLYAFGGDNGTATNNNAFLNSVEAYDPATNTWAPRASMPTPRAFMAAATAPDGQIYVVGGFSGSLQSADVSLATLEAYNPATNSWTTRASMPTARDSLAAAFGADGNLYVFGGETGGQGTGPYLSTVEAYNPASNTWSTRASMPTARDFLAAAPGSDGLIYVVGGFNGSDLSTVEAYNPATNSWTTKASMPTARGGLAATTASDGQLYAVGGFQGSGFAGTLEAYDPATNTWTTKASMPTPREELVLAAASDGRLYAYGGANGGSFLATNEAYLPAGLSGAGTRQITVSGGGKRPTTSDRIGLFHSDGTWTLDLGGNGSDPVTFLFGLPGDTPIVGDWNGAGFDEVGTVRVAPNAFAPDGRHALLVSLDYNGDRQWDGGDVSFYFGEEGDQIVLGDWNGDGRTKLGVVRPDGTGALGWSLDFNGNHNWIVYRFGLPGDTAIAGDWTGDGKDKIGVARADPSVTLADGSHPMRWVLDRAGTGVWDGTFITFGTSFDVVLVGDWSGDGRTKVGVAGPAANGVSATVFLDVNGDGVAEPSEQFAFGLVGDVIFRGDWTASGTDRLGVARSSSATSVAVALDTNGDHAYDAGDQAFALAGQDSDEVFVGKWHP